MATPARIEWWGDDVVSVRSFDLDTQRSGDALDRVTVLPVRAESGIGNSTIGPGIAGGAEHAAPLRTNLLDLLPTDTIVITDQESAVEREVERAWADAAHHLEVARRMGEEPPPRVELLIDPEAWRARLTGLARIAVADAETEQRFPLAPPEHIDRDLRRLGQIVAQPPPTVILCDNEGQLERLEELLGSDRATLAVGALDGGFIMPTLRVLTDHEIFRRARRLRRPRRYRSAVSTAAARAMTAELLDLYARRQLATGFAFPPDTPWQRELESAFLYEDTPDQRRASDEVKRDMERARPMDRLLVGDVGYGKTEVAVRAAFKAVQTGKQVAVLVPTTILAEQHGRTFRERPPHYPPRIEEVSRF